MDTMPPEKAYSIALIIRGMGAEGARELVKRFRAGETAINVESSLAMVDIEGDAVQLTLKDIHLSLAREPEQVPSLRYRGQGPSDEELLA